MSDKDLWKIDFYREQYMLASANIKSLEVEVRGLEMYIRFLEEEFKIRKRPGFNEEFAQWLKQKSEQDAQQKSRT